GTFPATTAPWVTPPVGARRRRVPALYRERSACQRGPVGERGRPRATRLRGCLADARYAFLVAAAAWILHLLHGLVDGLFHAQGVRALPRGGAGSGTSAGEVGSRICWAWAWPPIIAKMTAMA